MDSKGVNMNKIWGFLNSPLIVVIIALAVWPIFGALSGTYALKLGMKEIAKTVSNEVVNPMKSMQEGQDAKLNKILELKKDIEILNVGYAPAPWPSKLKVIGTIKNNSEETIKSINIISSFYQGDKLVDVKEDWLHKIKALRPGEAANFTFNKDIEEGAPKEMTVVVKISDFSILK